MLFRRKIRTTYFLREEDKWDKEMRGWKKKKKKHWEAHKNVCDEYFCFWRFFWGLGLYRVIKDYLEILPIIHLSKGSKTT
jgi:hypothetical protein